MAESLLTVVPDAGLGNSSYLLDLGDGRALAVDACRDLRGLRQAAADRGLKIAFAADTHLHADFLSGAVQLAAADGAEILASRAGGRLFAHRGLEDGEEVELGGLTLRAIGTPGHTDEHLSFLLLDGARELGVFTGGSLIVGSAARTDLVAPARTEELARAQFRSLRRLAALEEGTALWPTHGGGSFCSSAATGAGAVSTVGAERAGNPLLQAQDEDTFVAMLLSTSGSHPPYFHRLGEVNRRGPQVMAQEPTLPSLSASAVARLVEDGAVLVDVRPVQAFARAHPAGAVSIPLRPAFASWLGWLAPHDRPLVVIRDRGQDADDLLWQAAKIGYEDIRGELSGGVDAWAGAGLPVASVELVQPDSLAGMAIFDVRQESEFIAGHVPGARNVELGDVAARAGAVDDASTVVMCGHGERAMSAASLLRRAGVADVRVLDGGPDDVAAARCEPLQAGA